MILDERIHWFRKGIHTRKYYIYYDFGGFCCNLHIKRTVTVTIHRLGLVPGNYIVYIFVFRVDATMQRCNNVEWNLSTMSECNRSGRKVGGSDGGLLSTYIYVYCWLCVCVCAVIVCIIVYIYIYIAYISISLNCNFTISFRRNVYWFAVQIDDY